MLDSIRKNEHAGSFSRRQQLFVRYILFILIDLAVLNLFNEFWAYVSITYFSISLLAVLLLQILLQLTIAIEHRVAKYFIEKQGLKAKVHRALSTWLIL
ncbi:MAG: membrane protein YdbS with pleckstrin-like domain, partial [Paraglaciecola sp.]